MNRFIPGICLNTESPSIPTGNLRYTVKLQGHLFSESFEDGRYFVHVSPNRKIMLIRRHDDGGVFCVNHQLMIQDLERLSAFSERKELKAEYSQKYNVILVHLDL